MAFYARHLAGARCCSLPTAFSSALLGNQWTNRYLLGGRRWLRWRKPSAKLTEKRSHIGKREETREKLLQLEALRRRDAELQSIERTPNEVSGWKLILQLADIMRKTSASASDRETYQKARSDLIRELEHYVRKDEKILLQAAKKLPRESLEAVAVAGLGRVGLNASRYGEVAMFLKLLAFRIPGKGGKFFKSLSRTAGYVLRNRREFNENQLITFLWAFTVLGGIDVEIADLFLTVERMFGKNLRTMSPHNVDMLAEAIARSGQYPTAQLLRRVVLNVFVETLEKFSANQIVRIIGFLGEQEPESKRTMPAVIKGEPLQRIGRLLAGSLDKLSDDELARVAGIFIFNNYSPTNSAAFLKAMKREFLYRSTSLPTVELSYVSTFLATMGHLDAQQLEDVQLKLRQHMKTFKPDDFVQLLHALSREVTCDRNTTQQLAQEFAKAVLERTPSAFTPGQCATLLRPLLALDSCPDALAEGLVSRALPSISTLTANELTSLLLGIAMFDKHEDLAEELHSVLDQTVLDSSSLNYSLTSGICTAMVKLTLRHEDYLDAVAKYMTSSLMEEHFWNNKVVGITATAFTLLDFPCRQFFELAAKHYENNMALFEKSELLSQVQFINGCILNDLCPPSLFSHVVNLFPENLSHIGAAGKRALLDTHLLAKSKGVKSDLLLSKESLDTLARILGLQTRKVMPMDYICLASCVRKLCGQGTVLSGAALRYFGQQCGILLLQKNNQPAPWPQHLYRHQNHLAAEDVPDHTMAVLLLHFKADFCLRSSHLRGRVLTTVRAMHAEGLRTIHVDGEKWMLAGGSSKFIHDHLLKENIVLKDNIF